MKVLYFDCFAGAAGDMILGALLDLGVPFAALQQALGSLAVDGYSVTADRVVKGGLTSVKFRVHEHAEVGAAAGPGSTGTAAPPPHKHYHLKHIRAAIDRSALSDAGKARANAMFLRLAEAEAAIHDMSIEKVHLHEVGAIDSIIDIVGAVFALEWIGADRIVVSPMNVGGGMVRSAHGVFPVPAPATLRLLGEAPVYSSGVQMETLTPTGALVLTEYAAAYGSMPAMRVDRIGYGAGDRDLPQTPNVLRAVLGEASHSAPAMRVTVMACEIDDMNPQIFGVLMDRLYAAGALEVFYQPVQMKKNRPGTLMTVVCRPEDRQPLTDLVFAETTTIGVRHHEMDRECLDRETVPVPTPWGDVRIKVARRDRRVLNAQPEFDDVARVATEHGVPIKDVHAQAMKAWLDKKM
jgi:uncharacterized protein (TIGR00299 family) protein